MGPHKKRLKDMKEMQRQVQTSVRKEEKGPLMSIKLGGSSTKTGGGGGFKKGGFKNAFAPASGEVSEVKREEDEDNVFKKSTLTKEPQLEDADDSDVTDQEDYYDPRKPTGSLPDY